MNAVEMRALARTQTEKRYDRMFLEYVANIERSIEELAQNERLIYATDINYADQDFYKTRIIPYFKKLGFEAKIVEKFNEGIQIKITW